MLCFFFPSLSRLMFTKINLVFLMEWQVSCNPAGGEVLSIIGQLDVVPSICILARPCWGLFILTFRDAFTAQLTPKITPAACAWGARLCFFPRGLHCHGNQTGRKERVSAWNRSALRNKAEGRPSASSAFSLWKRSHRAPGLLEENVLPAGLGLWEPHLFLTRDIF